MAGRVGKGRRRGEADRKEGAAQKKPCSVCPHQRQRSKCKECEGASICPHQRRRNECHMSAWGRASARNSAKGANARSAGARASARTNARTLYNSFSLLRCRVGFQHRARIQPGTQVARLYYDTCEAGTQRTAPTVARWAEMPLERGLPQVASLPSGPHCLAEMPKGLPQMASLPSGPHCPHADLRVHS